MHFNCRHFPELGCPLPQTFPLASQAIVSTITMAAALVSLQMGASLLQPGTVEILVFWWKRTLTTLVLALTFCYTGLRLELDYPYVQVMAKVGEPRYQQKRDCYQQKELAIHDIPFSSFCERLDNRKYIILR